MGAAPFARKYESIDVHLAEDGRLLTVTLDRPKGNILTMQMMSEQPEIEFLSLSAAPLAQTRAQPGAGAGQERAGSLAARMLDFLGRSLEPVYGFRSLLAFKRKFQPEFQPLFMAYPDPVALPAIGIALARAYLPTLSMREALVFVRGLG